MNASSLFFSDSLLMTESLFSFLTYLFSLNHFISSIPFSLNELFLPSKILLLSVVSFMGFQLNTLLLFIEESSYTCDLVSFLKLLLFKSSFGALLYLESKLFFLSKLFWSLIISLWVWNYLFSLSKGDYSLLLIN